VHVTRAHDLIPHLGLFSRSRARRLRGLYMPETSSSLQCCRPPMRPCVRPPLSCPCVETSRLIRAAVCLACHTREVGPRLSGRFRMLLEACAGLVCVCSHASHRLGSWASRRRSSELQIPPVGCDLSRSSRLECFISLTRQDRLIGRSDAVEN
jgi:hypothetical protein